MILSCPDLVQKNVLSNIDAELKKRHLQWDLLTVKL